MRNRQIVSFEQLGERELLKSVGWWLGLAAAVTTAAWLYVQANPA